MNSRIRDQGLNHSQVMRTLHFLAGMYGPRLRIATPRTMGLWGHPSGVERRLTAHTL
jgi:hypothetical protein